MLNDLIKFTINKEIVLIEPHRQLLPMKANEENKKEFVFINVNKIWALIPLTHQFKLKYTIMYLILNIIKPRYILSINWLSRRTSLYKVWTKNKVNSQFVVVQHGSYVGGAVTRSDHRFTKCDVFLTWGPYFKRLFEDYNKGKKVKIVSFGNPVFNLYDRYKFNYKEVSQFNKKVLLLPTYLKGDDIDHFNDLLKKLANIECDFDIKMHSKQKIEEMPFNWRVIERNVYDLLQSEKYDIVISDKSTALLDAIHFKNRVLMFSPLETSCQTEYGRYLSNTFYQFHGWNTIDDLFNSVRIEAQEKLYNTFVERGDNSLKKI